MYGDTIFKTNVSTYTLIHWNCLILFNNIQPQQSVLIISTNLYGGTILLKPILYPSTTLYGATIWLKRIPTQRIPNIWLAIPLLHTITDPTRGIWSQQWGQTDGAAGVGVAWWHSNKIHSSSRNTWSDPRCPFTTAAYYTNWALLTPSTALRFI